MSLPLRRRREDPCRIIEFRNLDCLPILESAQVDLWGVCDFARSFMRPRAGSDGDDAIALLDVFRHAVAVHIPVVIDPLKIVLHIGTPPIESK